MRYLWFSFIAAAFVVSSCTKEEDAPPADPPTVAGPRLILKFKFDSTQARLNAFGLPSTVPVGHAAQSPVFNRMSAHYAEFAPLPFTPLGAGDVVYHAPETTVGGGTAIDHDQSLEVVDNGEFLNIPLTDLDTGVYQWLRVSLAYQNYDIRLSVFGIPLQGTIASFIGYNTYIGSYLIQDSVVHVNGNRAQGYWGFETYSPLVPVYTGQAPGTTVVNPLFATSPIPAGSCVVTGQFASPLHITGNETENVTVIVSLSTNRSFEWIEHGGNTIFQPLEGDTVVDMGVRGMIPIVQ
jgi:hypothetical protein